MVLHGWMTPAYPSAGSWVLAIDPSAVIGPRVCHVVMKLVEAAGRSASQPHPLRDALRLLENRAALLAQVTHRSSRSRVRCPHPFLGLIPSL